MKGLLWANGTLTDIAPLTTARDGATLVDVDAFPPPEMPRPWRYDPVARLPLAALSQKMPSAEERIAALEAKVAALESATPK